MRTQATVEILYPTDYLPTSNPAQSEVIENFISGLECALQVSRTTVSLAQLWKKDCPDGTEHDDIAAYLETVSYMWTHKQHHRLMILGGNISFLSRPILQPRVL